MKKIQKTKIIFIFFSITIILISSFQPVISENNSKNIKKNDILETIIDFFTEITAFNITDIEIIGKFAFFNSSGPITSKPKFRYSSISGFNFQPNQILTYENGGLGGGYFLDPSHSSATRTFSSGIGIFCGLQVRLSNNSSNFN